MPGVVDADEVGHLEARGSGHGVLDRLDGPVADRVVGLLPAVVDLRIEDDGVGRSRPRAGNLGDDLQSATTVVAMLGADPSSWLNTVGQVS